jgi:hypothetical protein
MKFGWSDNRRWIEYFFTLKGRMWGLSFISFVVLVVAVALSYWQTDNFNRFYYKVKSSSDVLQKQQEMDFRINRLLASIHSNLRLYMQSADKEILRHIRIDINRLSSLVPDSMAKDIKTFRKVVDVLEIRMHSLRENELNMLDTEESVYDILGEARLLLPASVFAEVYDVSINALVKKHRLHLVAFTFFQEDKRINMAVRELSDLFSDTIVKLEHILANIKGKNRELLQKLIDDFYILDESESTVFAIRLKTIETENTIVHTVENLKESLAEASLNNSRAYFDLLENEILHIRNNFFLIVANFILLALLFMLVNFLVNKQVFFPQPTSSVR